MDSQNQQQAVQAAAPPAGPVANASLPANQAAPLSGPPPAPPLLQAAPAVPVPSTISRIQTYSGVQAPAPQPAFALLASPPPPPPSVIDSVASFAGRIGSLFRRSGRGRPTSAPAPVGQPHRRLRQAPPSNDGSDEDYFNNRDSPLHMRRAIVQAMQELPVARRHLLLERLRARAGPELAPLFAYAPTAASPSQAAAAAAAPPTINASRPLDELLREVVAEVRAAPAPQLAGPAAPSTAPTTPGPAAAAEPPVSLALTPEWAELGSEAGSRARPARVVVSLKAAREVVRSSHLALTMVSDRSGSMAGPRIQLVKATSHFLIDQLQEGRDLLGLVSYASDVTTDLPLVLCSPAAKAFAHGVVDLMVASGGTALHHGLIEGLQQQMEFARTPEALSRVQATFLATDGEANVGPKTADEILPSMQRVMRDAEGGPQTITTHTFGFGNGHDARLLEAVAESAHGSYYYISQSEDIPNAYGDCLGGMLAVVAKSISVTLTALNGARLVGVSSGGRMEGAPNGGPAAATTTTTIKFADLFAEESRDTLVSLELPPPPPPGSASGASTSAAAAAAAAAPPLELLRVEVAFTEPSTGQQVRLAQVYAPVRSAAAANTAEGAHALVLTTAARFATAEAIERAQKMDEDGRSSEARQLLQSFASNMQQCSAASPHIREYDMYTRQTRVVEQSLAERTQQTQQAHFALHKSAAKNLSQQRTQATRVTSALPTAAMYDGVSRQAQRSKATAYVQKSVSTPAQH